MLGQPYYLKNAKFVTGKTTKKMRAIHSGFMLQKEYAIFYAFFQMFQNCYQSHCRKARTSKKFCGQ